jgi:hypothetical protein
LSYTTFSYANLRLSAAQVDSRGKIQIACDVTNTGPVAGDEVVQLYLHDREANVTRPVQELAGFKRVHLKPGMTCTVTFDLAISQLGFYNREMHFVVEPGHVDVMIGSSSADIRLRGEFEIVGETVEVLGQRAFLSEAAVSGAAGGERLAEPMPWAPPAPTPEESSPAIPPAGSFHAMLDGLAGLLTQAGTGSTTTIQWDITGEGVYRLVLVEGRAHVEVGEGPADAGMRMSLETAMRLMGRKLNPMIAVATGKIQISGNVQALMVLQRAMS